MVLLESRDIYWFGMNGTLQEPCYKPTKLNLSDKIPEIFPPSDQASSVVNPHTDFLVTKINCSWNKTLSLTDIIIADVRSLEGVTANAIQSSIKTLAHAWHSKEIEPPYIEAISKYFSVNTMRKPQAPSKPKASTKTKTNKKLASPTSKRR